MRGITLKTGSVMAGLFVASAAIAGGAALASEGADRSTHGDAAIQADWLTIGEIAQSLETQGYVVHEIEVDDGVYEVEATNADGWQVEAAIDPVTGEILPHHDND